MNTGAEQSSLATIWQQQRQSVMYMGQALHDQLPAGEPPVTIHGRELDPATEGVGFQFQLTMNGTLYGGKFRAAYYVVQIQLFKRKAGLGWLLDAMPILEVDQGNYDLFGKRTSEFAFRDRQALEHQMLETLAADATGFFRNVRDGVPPSEPVTPFGGGRTAPVL